MLFEKMVKLDNLNDSYFIYFDEYSIRFNNFSGRIGTIFISFRENVRGKTTKIEASDIVFDVRIKRILKQIIDRPVNDMVFHHIENEEEVSEKVKLLKKELLSMIEN